MSGSENLRHQKAAEEASTPGDHFSNLYDTEEDQAGSKIDEATGQKIDNTTSEAADENLSIVEPSTESVDVLGEISDDDDEAAQWLRSHDLG